MTGADIRYDLVEASPIGTLSLLTLERDSNDQTRQLAEDTCLLQMLQGGSDIVKLGKALLNEEHRATHVRQTTRPNELLEAPEIATPGPPFGFTRTEPMPRRLGYVSLSS